MLKQFVTFILLTSFAMQTFNKVFIVIDYNINTFSFAINCENIEKPLLQCHGKCQMIKALKEEDKKDQQSPDRRGENKNDNVLSDQSFFISFTRPLLSTFSHTYAAADEGNVVKMQKGIFHPPTRNGQFPG